MSIKSGIFFSNFSFVQVYFHLSLSAVCLLCCRNVLPDTANFKQGLGAIDCFTTEKKNVLLIFCLWIQKRRPKSLFLRGSAVDGQAESQGVLMRCSLEQVCPKSGLQCHHSTWQDLFIYLLIFLSFVNLRYCMWTNFYFFDHILALITPHESLFNDLPLLVK